MKICIIGGGASGMAAALAASENPAAEVILLERQARLGKKLSATGNGRCNLSNRNALSRGYHGEDVSFCAYALGKFPPEDTLNWFASLGLLTVTEESGKVYPYSDQANSVVDVLRLSLDRPNIRVLTGFDVKKIRREEDGFSVSDGEQTVQCQRLIVACGGLAGTELGGTMSGYKLLQKLGHRVTKLRPSIVQLKSTWGGVASLKGVRANCHAAIFRNGELFRESEGEVQFTDYGISGPVIMEISRDVCAQPGEWECRLDFLPGQDTLMPMLLQRKNTSLSTDDLLTGILHNRLGRVLTKAAGIRGGQSVSALTEEDLETVCRVVRDFRIPVAEPMGMDRAQVTAGGVVTEDFDPNTMESRLVSGLYACGEVLDIDGDCGGYNLQWAWSSGRLAGLNAGGVL